MMQIATQLSLKKQILCTLSMDTSSCWCLHGRQPTTLHLWMKHPSLTFFSLNIFIMTWHSEHCDRPHTDTGSLSQLASFFPPPISTPQPRCHKDYREMALTTSCPAVCSFAATSPNNLSVSSAKCYSLKSVLHICKHRSSGPARLFLRKN